jgi:hypothetical protein
LPADLVQEKESVVLWVKRAMFNNNHTS